MGCSASAVQSLRYIRARVTVVCMCMRTRRRVSSAAAVRKKKKKPVRTSYYNTYVQVEVRYIVVVRCDDDVGQTRLLYYFILTATGAVAAWAEVMGQWNRFDELSRRRGVVIGGRRGRWVNERKKKNPISCPLLPAHTPSAPPHRSNGLMPDECVCTADRCTVFFIRLQRVYVMQEHGYDFYFFNLTAGRQRPAARFYYTLANQSCCRL